MAEPVNRPPVSEAIIDARAKLSDLRLTMEDIVG